MHDCNSIFFPNEFNTPVFETSRFRVFIFHRATRRKQTKCVHIPNTRQDWGKSIELRQLAYTHIHTHTHITQNVFLYLCIYLLIIVFIYLFGLIMWDTVLLKELNFYSTHTKTNSDIVNNTCNNEIINK